MTDTLADKCPRELSRSLAVSAEEWLWLQSWLEGSQFPWFYRLLFAAPVTAEGAPGFAALGTALWALTWPQPGPCTDVEVGMDFYLSNWHQLALQPEALKNRSSHLNNLCPSHLCNFRNALDEDLCPCLIKQLVCLSLGFFYKSPI